MKKIIFVVLVAVIALTFFTGFTYEDVYANCGIVVSVDYDEDIVTIEDFSGNLWQFFGCEDWEINDICAMVMNTNGTDIIFDDIIVNATYCGWVN